MSLESGADAIGGEALVALGANVPGRWGVPEQALPCAVRALEAMPGVRVMAASRLWRSRPFGRLRQPPFVNAVVRLRTVLPPRELLRRLRALELAAGRRGGVPWTARALDLDLLDHDGRVTRPVGMGRRATGWNARLWQRKGLVLPHPGLMQRAFVLRPLLEVAPHWRHPLTGVPARALLARLPAVERAGCRPLRHDAAGRAGNRPMEGDACLQPPITIECN